MFAALARGTSRIAGLLEGADCLATARALRALGVDIRQSGAHWRVRGVGLEGLRQPAAPLDLGNSGTSMRLLAGILAGQPFRTVLTGDTSLQARPMARIADPLERMGAHVRSREGGFAPLEIEGRRPLRAISYDLPVASAQVKSAVLLAGLVADGAVAVREPSVTRDHTERMLATFGFPVRREADQVILMPGGELKACDIEVPGDLSSAAFLVLAATLIPGSDLLIEQVGVNPTRIGVIDLLQRMGANIELSRRRSMGHEPVADLRVRAAKLRGIEIDADAVALAVDEIPVLMIAAAVAQGVTTLGGAAELRVKESDRLSALAEGLARLGIAVEERPDGLRVQGGRLEEGTVRSFGDHRIAMAFAMAGAVARGSVRVQDVSAVATSYPEFEAQAREAGLDIELERSGEPDEQ
jgi:3-phosphoshikimate 1-carboxyvinyltransferase